DPRNITANRACSGAMIHAPYGAQRMSISAASPQNISGNTGITGAMLTLPRFSLGTPFRISLSALSVIAATAHRHQTNVSHERRSHQAIVINYMKTPAPIIEEVITRQTGPQRPAP